MPGIFFLAFILFGQVVFLRRSRLELGIGSDLKKKILDKPIWIPFYKSFFSFGITLTVDEKCVFSWITNPIRTSLFFKIFPFFPFHTSGFWLLLEFPYFENCLLLISGFEDSMAEIRIPSGGKYVLSRVDVISFFNFSILFYCSSPKRCMVISHLQNIYY